MEAPTYQTWAQCTFSSMLLLIMHQMGNLMPANFQFLPPTSFRVCLIGMWQTLPLGLTLAAKISLNNLLLQQVDVAYYFIGKSYSIVFYIFFTWMILGESTSTRAIISCIVVIIGFLVVSEQEITLGI